MVTMEDLFTVRQVQGILKVDRITIYRMINDGRLHGIKIGQQWRFPRMEIERILGQESENEIFSESVNLSNASDSAFPTHCIQTIQDLFTEISQLYAIVVDLNGDPATEAHHSSQFCTLLQKSPSARDACRDCWRQAAQAAKEQTRLVCHAGLNLMCIPLKNGDTQIGAIVMGEFYWQTPDRAEEKDRVQRLAEQYGLDQGELLHAISEIPVIPPEKHPLVEAWPLHTANAMHSILNERTGFIQRLQKIADLTQVS